MLSRNCVTLKILIKFKIYNIRNGAIRWPISTSRVVILEHFSLSLTVFQIDIEYDMISRWFCDLKNISLGHGVQHAQWCLLLPNIKKINNNYNWHFCASSHRFRDINVSNVWRWKFRPRLPSKAFQVMPFGGENEPLWNSCWAFLRWLSSFRRY